MDNNAFSALMPLDWRWEGDPARKNFCIKTHWGIIMVVNVGGQCTAQRTVGTKSFGQSYEDAQFKND